MNKPEQPAPPLQSLIGHQILLLRAQRVMLDAALAELYDVPTKALVHAVKRNPTRFPADFMFQISAEAFKILRSQTVTSNKGRGDRRTAANPLIASASSVIASAAQQSTPSPAQQWIATAFGLVMTGKCSLVASGPNATGQPSSRPMPSRQRRPHKTAPTKLKTAEKSK
jgi:hypothetical protein